MKKILMTILAAFAASAALAADRVWTGGGANHAWTNALNWTDGRVPGSSDTAVFNLSGNEYVYLVKTDANKGNIQVKGISVSGGNLYFGAGQTIWFPAPTGTIYVAENARVVFSNYVCGAASKATTLVKTGLGTARFENRLGYSGASGNKDFDTIDVREGLLYRGYAVNRNLYTDKLVIRRGAEFKAPTYNSLDASMVLTVEDGGFLTVGASQNTYFDGLRGAGTVRYNGGEEPALNMNLVRDEDYVFSGVAENVNLIIPPAAKTPWTIANTNALLNATLTVGTNVVRFADSDATYKIGTLAVLSGVEFAVTNRTLDVANMNNSGRYVQTGGVVRGVENGVLWGDKSAAAKNLLSGGTLRLGSASAASVMAGFTVSNGGILEILRGWTTTSGASSPALEVDNATLRFMPILFPESWNWPASGSPWTLKAGAGGAKVEGLVEQSFASATYRQLNWYATAGTMDGVAVDGGIDFAWPGVLNIYKPQAHYGPTSISDGYVTLQAEAFTGMNGAAFGTNDFTLGNCWLEIPGNTDRHMTFAAAEGAKFRYGRSGAICILPASTTVGHTVTIGSPGAAESPIVRVGKGSMIAFAKVTNNSVMDGTKGRVFVNGGVDCYANGLVKGPIFAYTKSKGSAAYAFWYEFLKYDMTLGLVACSDLYTAGLDGGAGSIANLNGATANYSVAANEEKTVLALAVRGSTKDASPLTINAGATLHVGDGTDPACVILDNYSGYGGAWIKGSGTLDFGTSEGVFALNFNPTTSGYAPYINPVIAGSGGVTFSGVFAAYASGQSYTHPPTLSINGNNTYSGGTWINSVQIRPTKATAFGTGTVDVGAGMTSGGQIRFGTAGLTFANNFVIRGHGVKQNGNSATATDNGALWFAANTTISGNVAIDRFARVSTTNAAASARAVISGVVSGGKLKVRNGIAPVVLSNSNTYTGGTEVVSATLAVVKGDSLGTGDVTLNGGILRFENDEDVTFTNAVSGIGTIVLAGKGSVTFTDKAFAALPSATVYRKSVFPFPNVADGTFTEKRGLAVIVW